MQPADLLRKLDYSVLQQCMHCGLCLPSCPTYVESGLERSSPRGRIALMRAVADGELGVTPAFAEEMSYCVGCLACTTACPAGVDYAGLLGTARAEVESGGVAATPVRGALRAFFLRGLFTRPRALRAAGRLLWLWQALGLQSAFRALGLSWLLPRRLRELEAATPRIARRFSDALVAPVEPARGERRHRVALLTGCVQDLVFSDVNRATAEVLAENGCEVVTPRAQHCCGSLHAHNGDPDTARLLARRQLDAIDPFAFDAIVSNAAGCGSHLRHYDRLLAGDPVYAARAAEWSRKLKDISEWLVEIGFRAPQGNRHESIERVEDPALAEEPAGRVSRPNHKSSIINRKSDLAVTYQEACHLCHGQGITAQPRKILSALPGVEQRECAEATWCCGSAGIYSITQPRTAAWLLRRKLDSLGATGADVIATANPGCHLHLEKGLRARGGRVPRVVHPVVLLAEAYRAERGAGVAAFGNARDHSG